jgi:hypothetical protein
MKNTQSITVTLCKAQRLALLATSGMKHERLSQAQMSECKLRVVKLNYFQGPQGIFIMGGENVGVADGFGMTLYKVKILLWR